MPDHGRRVFPGLVAGREQDALLRHQVMGKLDLFTVDAQEPWADHVRLTNDFFDEADPSWSPDRKTIAFSSDRRDALLRASPWTAVTKDSDQYLAMNADGTGSAAGFPPAQFSDRSPSRSPDGKNIVFTSDRNGINNPTARSIWMQMTVTPSDQPSHRRLGAQSGLRMGTPSPSPVSRTGGWDVYVLEAPARAAT